MFYAVYIQLKEKKNKLCKMQQHVSHFSADFGKENVLLLTQGCKCFSKLDRNLDKVCLLQRADMCIWVTRSLPWGVGRVIFIAFFKHYRAIPIACQKVEESASFWFVYALFIVLGCPTSHNRYLLEWKKLKHTHKNKVKSVPWYQLGNYFKQLFRDLTVIHMNELCVMTSVVGCRLLWFCRAMSQYVGWLRWHMDLCLLLITAHMVDSLTWPWATVGSFFDLQPWASQSSCHSSHSVLRTTGVNGTFFTAIHHDCHPSL